MKCSVTAHAVRTVNKSLDQLTVILVEKGIVVTTATEATDSLVSGIEKETLEMDF